MLRGLRQRLSEKDYVLNGYCALGSAFAAEVYAREGFDAITVDLQHGMTGYDSLVPMLQALAGVDVVPLVRLPWLDPGLIMKVLDSGALGVTCPMINTAEELRRLIGYCKYPPRGERSMGPIRAAVIHGDGYAAAANQHVSVSAMIETAAGLDNVEAIAAVEGLDCLYIGPGDLSLALGKPPRLDRFDPEVDRAVERILTAAKKNGVAAGIFAPDGERAWEMVERGFQFVTLSTDARALAAQTKTWVQGFRAAGAKAQKK